MNAAIYHKRAEAAKHIAWTLMIVFGVCLLVLLYGFKTMASSARKDVLSLERQIEAEKSSIQLLKAEIVFLGRADRLNMLSGSYLGLEPIKY